jgi:hypothetical protein
MTTLHSRKSIDRLPLRRGFRFGALALVLACCALPPASRALLPQPAPDGGYPNRNTAEGDNALYNLMSGSDNTAVGFNALFSLTSGFDNTATGAGALYRNTMGTNNTANGSDALHSNTRGVNNTATGSGALHSNTMGIGNTANGFDALEDNTTGDRNTATGAGALYHNTMGSYNTANGQIALYSNTIGSYNTATGSSALYQSTGSNNIALGFGAGGYHMTGNNNIFIGSSGASNDAAKIRIGMQGLQTGTYIAGIRYAAVTGSPVVIGVDGKLGVTMSSARFKEGIKPIDKASEAILALKPVTFHYKKEVDPDGIPQFGLVAEQVEKVNPDLVARDEQGKVYSVRYDAVNAMLLNEFLKEHRKVEQLEKGMAVLTAQLKEQAAQIQKVSAQLEARKPAPQVVENP